MSCCSILWLKKIINLMKFQRQYFTLYVLLFRSNSNWIRGTHLISMGCLSTSNPSIVLYCKLTWNNSCCCSDIVQRKLLKWNCIKTWKLICYISAIDTHVQFSCFIVTNLFSCLLTNGLHVMMISFSFFLIRCNDDI